MGSGAIWHRGCLLTLLVVYSVVIDADIISPVQSVFDELAQEQVKCHNRIAPASPALPGSHGYAYDAQHITANGRSLLAII